VFGLILLAALFAPQILQAIPGLVILAAVALVCGVVATVLFFTIRRVIRQRRNQPETPPPIATPVVQAANPPGHPHPLENTSRLTLQEKLRAIDWFQFEKVVAAIYEVPGCAVRRLGGARSDGGIDLIAEQDGRRIVVQCKHWRKWTVGVRHIRELLGAMTDTNAQKGVLVTLRGCTQDAIDLANKHSIDIIDETGLIALMQMSDGSIDSKILALLNDRRKLCPKCESELVLRTAERGVNRGDQFWGCSNYPRCRYILRNA
jgi:restriction system protein